MRFSIALAIAALCMVPAAAQNAAPAPEAYRPGLGDLMTMTVQPRHIKLLLAGHEQNWVYAKYELHELQEAFDRAVRVWPRFKGLSRNRICRRASAWSMAASTLSSKNPSGIWCSCWPLPSF